MDGIDGLVDRLRTLANEKVPDTRRDELRFDVVVRGRSVTVVERRPVWDTVPTDWTRHPRFEVRLDARAGRWQLWRACPAGGWEPYVPLPDTPDVDALLAEIAADPTAALWS